jgi:hypothetical protein
MILTYITTSVAVSLVFVFISLIFHWIAFRKQVVLNLKPSDAAELFGAEIQWYFELFIIYFITCLAIGWYSIFITFIVLSIESLISWAAISSDIWYTLNQRYLKK